MENILQSETNTYMIYECTKQTFPLRKRWSYLQFRIVEELTWPLKWTLSSLISGSDPIAQFLLFLWKWGSGSLDRNIVPSPGRNILSEAPPVQSTVITSISIGFCVARILMAIYIQKDLNHNNRPHVYFCLGVIFSYLCVTFHFLIEQGWENLPTVWTEIQRDSKLSSGSAKCVRARWCTPKLGSSCPRISWHAFTSALGWAWWTNSVASALTRYYAAWFLSVGIR